MDGLALAPNRGPGPQRGMEQATFQFAVPTPNPLNHTNQGSGLTIVKFPPTLLRSQAMEIGLTLGSLLEGFCLLVPLAEIDFIGVGCGLDNGIFTAPQAIPECGGLNHREDQSFSHT